MAAENETEVEDLHRQLHFRIHGHHPGTTAWVNAVAEVVVLRPKRPARAPSHIAVGYRPRHTLVWESVEVAEGPRGVHR